MAEKRYYWLKLKRDFFKRHDIQIIESMPNGKDYVLFYLKLLVESIDHNGQLRFSDTIPYNEQMLATITNMNIDVVRSAMKVFTELKMIEVLDDQTIFLAEIDKMVGHETYWAEQKRKQRLSRKLDNVQLVSDLSKQEIEKELEIDKDKEIDIKKPPKHKHGEYKNVLLTDNELEKLKRDFPDWQERIERLSGYIASKGTKYASHYATIRQWAAKDRRENPQPKQTRFEIQTIDGQEVAVPIE